MNTNVKKQPISFKNIMCFTLLFILLRKRRRRLKRRDALQRLSSHAKVCESRCFFSSHVASLVVLENELFFVVGDEVNDCGMEYLTGLLQKSRVIVIIS